MPGHVVNLTVRPLVMGVLNLTRDSFSDAGEFLALRNAYSHAERMIAEGADIIDVGGESTRPGADPVPDAEQIRLTQPVISSIHERYSRVHISIDTQLAQVAAAAIDAGANMVNDISALRSDPMMIRLVAERNVHVVLMHMQGTPRTMQTRPHYDEVITEVRSFLAERIDFAVANGIDRGKVIIDPGIGFGKTVGHNLQLLAGLKHFADLAPVLLGTSRKSFIGKVLDIDDPKQRLTGTIVTNTIGLLAGVSILRVHDVREARQTIALLEAIIPPSARGS